MAAAKKPAARKKGASRKSAPARKGAPGALWLVLGLLAGLFVAFLWHLWELKKDARPPVATTEAQPAAGTGKAGGNSADAAGPGKAAEPRFEFYTLLPNQEVMPGSKPAPAQPAARGDEDGPAFLLQAGSFKSEAEADRRRASILMLGMPVKVVKVPVKPGEAWYRVMVGPFKGKDAAASARASLKGNGVETLVVKQG
ncbi:MAG TPA: SPOR domain-containing protein [Moraxellaceae bacterium]|nr:SPOR domain-containing protein [Moraxellaceae bacterium]